MGFLTASLDARYHGNHHESHASALISKDSEEIKLRHVTQTPAAFLGCIGLAKAGRAAWECESLDLLDLVLWVLDRVRGKDVRRILEHDSRDTPFASTLGYSLRSLWFRPQRPPSLCKYNNYSSE